jgi:hypothetical protein
MKTGLKNAVFLGVATVLVLGAVIAAIAAMGGPSEQRARSLDEARLTSLRNLATQIDVFTMRETRLPAAIDELSGRGGFQPAKDPKTGAPFEYRVTGAKTYEMCATFERASDDPRVPGRPADIWSHTAGRQCFALAARELAR